MHIDDKLHFIHFIAYSGDIEAKKSTDSEAILDKFEQLYLKLLTKAKNLIQKYW